MSGTGSPDCLRALPPLWGFYEAVAWITGKVGHSLGKNSAHWASLQTGPLALAAVATGESKSKLVLLTTRQANKWKDRLLGPRIVILFRKPAGQEDGGLLSQRTIFSELEFRLLLY